MESQRQFKGHVLVTGSSGFIGSHVVLALLEAGYDVVSVASMKSSVSDKDSQMPESLRRVQQMTGKSVHFMKVDLLDMGALREVFKKYEIGCVVHLAALKAAAESFKVPLIYYRINVGGTINLLKAMKEANVKRIVYCSSFTVYGDPEYLPVDERHKAGSGCTNPYGRSKYMGEEILKDLCNTQEDWRCVSLRCFTVAGAHPKGTIGENTGETPTTLMSFLPLVAKGDRPELKVFGMDYKTKDGTVERDFVHVVDVADAHVAAVRRVTEKSREKYEVFNVGSGKAFTILECLHTFEKMSGRKIPYSVGEKRPGDFATFRGDVSLAEKCLGWKPKKTLEEMCADTWKWICDNPKGYLS